VAMMSQTSSTAASARPKVELLAEMLSKIQDEGVELSVAPGVGNIPDAGEALMCVFDFEPRLRYLRYIVEFNRLLNEYTEFTFDVYSIRRGCIDVCYYAKAFSEKEKNTVRRQIMRLVREHDIARSYHISRFILFGKLYQGVTNDSSSR
jgi:hypothetical protein